MGFDPFEIFQMIFLNSKMIMFQINIEMLIKIKVKPKAIAKLKLFGKLANKTIKFLGDVHTSKILCKAIPQLIVCEECC